MQIHVKLRIFLDKNDEILPRLCVILSIRIWLCTRIYRRHS